ncbi:hypothetical protein [Mycoplasma sp. HF14]
MRSLGNVISSQIYNAISIQNKPPYWYQLLEENTDAIFFKQEKPTVFSRYLNNDVNVLSFQIYFIQDSLSHIEQLNSYKEMYQQLTQLTELKDYIIIAKALNNLIIDNNEYIAQADNIVTNSYDLNSQAYVINYEILIKAKEQNVKD